MPHGRGATAAGPLGFRVRPARVDDLPRCGQIWRSALNDYFVRLGLPLIPAGSTSVARLHAHTLATDPHRFAVAERSGLAAAAPAQTGREAQAEILGFAAALLRDRTWYLSMLFVEPDAQGAGLGRALLDWVLPPPEERARLCLALASDSAQPIANGLYAALGIVPRMPVWNLVGRPVPDALPPLPDAISALADERLSAMGAEIAALDRDVLGFEHPDDHRFALESGRLRFLYRAADGSLAGYGYASPVGHVGPVAVRDPELMVPVLAHLVRAVPPRGASSIWLPGAAGAATSRLVQAGLRFDGFPVLLCWSRPFADFERYVPHSPGLL